MSAQREKMVRAAVEMLEREGVQSLSVRNLAAKLGTSTMAVYTHFGNMAGLLDAVACDALGQFADALAGVVPTEDAVADLFQLGFAYHQFAVANPQRYQLIFGTAGPASLLAARSDVTATGSPTVRPEWAVTFEVLRTAVRRMIEAGRIRDDGCLVMAARLWTICHGVVTLEMAGYFGRDGHGLTEILGPLTIDTLVGMGDDRELATKSLTAAVALVGG